MAYIIDKFVCSLCHSEYSTLEEAKECEKMGQPEEGNQYKEGDSISYKNEDASLSLNVLRNRIILKMIRNVNGKHVWVYIVEQNLLGIPTHEKGVLLVNISENYKEWVGPAGLTYKLGFAEYTKNILKDIELHSKHL